MNDHKVLIVNDLFEGENMLIIKSSGSESIVRHNEPFKKKEVLEYLHETGVNLETCKMYQVENDWSDKPKIERVY